MHDNMHEELIDGFMENEKVSKSIKENSQPILI